jgi:hypothetical protein
MPNPEKAIKKYIVTGKRLIADCSVGERAASIRQQNRPDAEHMRSVAKNTSNLPESLLRPAIGYTMME